MIQVASATIQDFVSFRSTVEGSFFIRHLCKVLQDHGHEKTLADLMIIVNSKVGHCHYHCHHVTIAKVLKYLCIVITEIISALWSLSVNSRLPVTDRTFQANQNTLRP